MIDPAEEYTTHQRARAARAVATSRLRDDDDDRVALVYALLAVEARLEEVADNIATVANVIEQPR